MKKSPSSSTLINIHHDKNPSNHTKHDKSSDDFNLKSYRNIPQNKKQNILKLDFNKHYQPLITKKNQVADRKNGEINFNTNNQYNDKYQYQTLKNRLHALEDRLIQIKKSYEIRKNKAHHFSIQKNPLPDNPKYDKLIPHYKKKLYLQYKFQKQLDNLTQRLPVQSPKFRLLQEIHNNKKIDNFYNSNLQKKKKNYDLACDQLLSQYVTQYQQKPVHFKHTSSEINLVNRSDLRKKSHENIRKDKYNHCSYYISAVIQAFQSPKPTSFDQLCASHLLTSYQFLCYIKNSTIQKPPKPPTKPHLHSPTKKTTLIFDLDQTLIHCLDAKKSLTADISLPVQFPDKNQVIVGINIRPYTKECLKELSENFEIMVFTASHANYANAIVDYLDPDKLYISYRFSREHCFKTQQGFYIKDLRVVDRKLSNLLLIDNAAFSYSFQPQNGIPIVPFYDNKADLQLKNLIPYLKLFINESDVRIRNNQTMKINQYTKFKNVQDLINGLYK